VKDRNIAVQRSQAIGFGREKARAGILNLVLFTGIVIQSPAFATGSVTLAWNPSPDPSVAGYDIYYGGASGVYTAKISVGAATSATISGLLQGATYYFAASTYSAEGIESPFSSELVYAVPNAITLSLNVLQSTGTLNSLMVTANGTVPGYWVLQSSPDLKNWTAIAQGTNSSVNVSAAVNGSPMQFFRLVTQ